MSKGESHSPLRGSFDRFMKAPILQDASFEPGFDAFSSAG